MSLNLFDLADVGYRYEDSRDVAFQPALTGTRPIPASDDCYDLNEGTSDPSCGWVSRIESQIGQL